MIDFIVNFTRRLSNRRSSVKAFVISLTDCYPGWEWTCLSHNKLGWPLGNQTE